MTERWKIRNDETLAAFSEHVRGRLAKGDTVIVEMVKPIRSTEQNKLLHAMLHDVARQKGDETPDELKRYVKLHFGVPKLRARDDVFRERYDRVIKNRLSYEEKLLAMDLLDVTSHLREDEMSTLLDETERHFASQGVRFRH